MGDRGQGCETRAFRSEMRAMGAVPVVPYRRGAKQAQPCPASIYRHRNLIERCWSRLKERRAVATRYDKTAASYAAGIAIAATLDWIKSSLLDLYCASYARPPEAVTLDVSAAPTAPPGLSTTTICPSRRSIRLTVSASFASMGP